MAKFYGAIGYAINVEVRPGIWEPVITERPYYGDVNRNVMQVKNADKVNDDVSLANEISILADPFAYDNFHTMKYIRYMGAEWRIDKVEVKNPRLILTIGGVYNGQTA